MAARLGLGGDLADCSVAGVVVPNTNVLRIDVEGPDRKRVSEVANALAAETRDDVRSLYRIFTLRWLSEARPPSRPFFPDRRRNLLVGGMLGILLGVAAALLVERRGDGSGSH